ncbi:MAG: serine hydrolase [Ignavibacteriaceae bacterium]|nr:serine hydrolase [Ignavibacteriaceae bacterium]
MSLLKALVLAVAFASALFAQNFSKGDPLFLKKLLEENRDSLLGVTDNPSKYKLQILYTQIERDSENNPSFRTFSYRVNDTLYFYPASTVKFPAALIALEKLNEAGINGLNRNSYYVVDTPFSPTTPVKGDVTSKNGKASIAHYIKKILLVSDNDAYNRLYDFTGQKELNERLHQKGFKSVRLNHRLSMALDYEGNRFSNEVKFYNDSALVYVSPPKYNSDSVYNDMYGLFIGLAYIGADGVIKRPLDFTVKNYISLTDLQKMLISVMFPAAVNPAMRFSFSESDRQFLLKYMSMYPRENDYPEYRKHSWYTDNYVKFLMFGDNYPSIPGNIRIFNKVGNAYGFVIDNAYVADFDAGIEFFLSAVIYTNEDEILNDDRYEYETVAFPFMARLGRIIYRYELARERKNKPDLNEFRIDYSRPD